MRFEIKLKDDFVRVTVRRKPERRMNESTFLGKNRSAVGGFFAWSNCHTFLGDRMVRQLLADDIRDSIIQYGVKALCEKEFDRYYEIVFPRFIGWSAIDSLGAYSSDVSEMIEPECSRTLEIRQIKKSMRHIPAPLTNLATISYWLWRERNSYGVSIASIRPGPDVGSMHGQVSVREKAVFFPPGHSCTPLPVLACH